MGDKRAFTIIELIIVIGIFLVTIAVLAPFVRMAQARADRIECATNLRNISLGLHRFEADHNGKFPESFSELYPEYVESENVFDCPASKSVGTAEKPDYVYNNAVVELSSPWTVIAEDAAGNHGKKGKNVLRLGGSVDWIKASR